MTTADVRSSPRLSVVAEAFLDRSLTELLDWLAREAPAVSGLELGSGGYAPTPHCDRDELLRDDDARRRWLELIRERDFAVVALNVAGNPLDPDPQVGARHDADLRESIRLAALIGVDRVVAMAGCPPAVAGDRTPYFAMGGWLPYLERRYDAQWETSIGPYWAGLSEFARSEHPDLTICLELHPGSAAYNVETFSRVAGLGDNLGANLDPSHFFWQQMDTFAVIDALGERIAHAHAKDLVYNPAVLATEGLLDHRIPGPTSRMPWKFATVGDGHDATWWSRFVSACATTRATAISIEVEDPDLSAEQGVAAGARLLASILRASR